MSTPTAKSGGSSSLLAWLRLFRAPNVFTALADVAMGFLVVRASLEPLGLFICLATASALLYTAGMVLNDVFDCDVDAKERPFRPLPSGQISLPLARTLGYAMLAFGVLFGTLAGSLYPSGVWWRSGLVALILAGCVLLYDGWLKRLPIGPLGMGLCRFFNVLLGMSVASSVAVGWPLGYDASNLLPAAGIGVYIVGVTMFAKGEAGKSYAWVLSAGIAVMAMGIGLLAWAGTLLQRREIATGMYWLLLAVLLLTVVNRCLMAIMDPRPERVQAGVKNAIFSLVLFDAAVSLMAAPSGYALGIVALLIPMFVLGRWVYST